ncbi:hypothetical protein AVEN_209190-1 [Araneus ventricosus]|uniref:Uncharacterized protein n=1 Tax=Araneus ventricosus TaxID=182803 RepID=A0A4Y2LH86_ARAVE|nr:hypothetical protein AVEN_209190-1 [Araneus ventricosus]
MKLLYALSIGQRIYTSAFVNSCREQELNSLLDWVYNKRCEPSLLSGASVFPTGLDFFFRKVCSLFLYVNLQLHSNPDVPAVPSLLTESVLVFTW